MYLGVISTVLFLAAAIFAVNAEAQDSTNQKCGKIVTENSYPWLVGLNYSIIMEGNNVEKFIGCSGVLISEKHVVIPALCLNDQRSSFANFNCTGANTRVPIEKIVTHPKYNRLYRRSHQPIINDIALVTLRDAVLYTDAVRPICLPSTDITQAASTDLKLQVTGFRRLLPGGNVTSTRDQLTQRENISFFDSEECQMKDSRKVPEDQICTDDKEGVISCMLGGAPLMNKRGDSYELIGLMNRGRRGCGVESQSPTEQYTNVFYNLDWLSSEMAK